MCIKAEKKKKIQYRTFRIALPGIDALLITYYLASKNSCLRGCSYHFLPFSFFWLWNPKAQIYHTRKSRVVFCVSFIRICMELSRDVLKQQLITQSCLLFSDRWKKNVSGHTNISRYCAIFCCCPLFLSKNQCLVISFILMDLFQGTKSVQLPGHLGCMLPLCLLFFRFQ